MLALFLFANGLNAQPESNESVRTRVPANINYLVKLLGVTLDSAQARITKGGFKYKFTETPVEEDKGKVAFDEWEGITRKGHMIVLGYDISTKTIVSVSYNAYKRDYYSRLMNDSLRTAGYKWNLRPNPDGKDKDVWTQVGKPTIVITPMAADQYDIEAILETESKRRRL
ncbi:MAG: hypothetical protein EOO11_11420 [Chitinophagaceae bacterium]|nr:MAG: hypothetical protein EOO11_11420 [Chitinophagaceae bacterium]